MNKFSELRDSGLLWWLNTKALHPYGLNLGLSIDDSGEIVGYTIHQSDEGPWEYDEEFETEAKENFARFLDSFEVEGSMSLNNTASVGGAIN